MFSCEAEQERKDAVARETAWPTIRESGSRQSPVSVASAQRFVSKQSTHTKKKKKKKGKKRPRKPASAEALGHSVDEACRRLNVSKPTLYRMMADGTLRYVLVRKMRRIPTEEYRRLGLISEDAER
jgi:excisionase family DNA binding protein